MFYLKQSTLIISLLVIKCFGSDTNRIINGHPVGRGQYLFQVSLHRSYNNLYFCSGSIINEEFIITAAHCLFYKWGGLLPKEIIKIICGQTDLNFINSNTIYRDVSKIFIHQDYNSNNFANDIALLRLSEPLTLDNGNLQKIQLNFDKGPYVGLLCNISGWGDTFYGQNKISHVLLSTEVQIINSTICQSKYSSINREIGEGIICASGLQNNDACQGDSGGTLICQGKLYGIISSGHECGNPNYPGVYMDIAYYSSWINQVLVQEKEIDFRIL